MDEWGGDLVLISLTRQSLFYGSNECWQAKRLKRKRRESCRRQSACGCGNWLVSCARIAIFRSAEILRHFIEIYNYSAAGLLMVLAVCWICQLNFPGVFLTGPSLIPFFSFCCQRRPADLLFSSFFLPRVINLRNVKWIRCCLWCCAGLALEQLYCDTTIYFGTSSIMTECGVLMSSRVFEAQYLIWCFYFAVCRPSPPQRSRHLSSLRGENGHSSGNSGDFRERRSFLCG